MKEIITTFFTIFLAEIADKTQFAVISFAANSKSPFNIWLGATLAFCLTNLLGVLFGCLLCNVFKPEIMKYISGAVFILVGIWTLISK